MATKTNSMKTHVRRGTCAGRGEARPQGEQGQGRGHLHDLREVVSEAAREVVGVIEVVLQRLRAGGAPGAGGDELGPQRHVGEAPVKLFVGKPELFGAGLEIGVVGVLDTLLIILRKRGE
jgi:hypothetical protein